MADIRVYELAKQLGLDNKVVKQILTDNGFEIKSHMSTISNDAIEVVKKSTEKVKEKVKDKLDNTSLELLKLIIEDPGYNYSYLSKRLGISIKTISIRFKNLQ